MKITVSVFGRFHAFDLARELHRAGHLEKLITSYPKFEVIKYGVPKEKIISLAPIEILRRLLLKIFRTPRHQRTILYGMALLYDMTAARFIPGRSDLFVGWSSTSLFSVRRANAMGMKTVLERGSSHMRHQCKVVREEAEKWGFEPDLAHPGLVRRELLEYDRVDYVSIPSSHVRASFLAHGFDPDRLIQTPYGVDPRCFGKRPGGDATFRIIHCGAISPHKGVHHLVAAFHDLNLPDSELWLIGSLSREIQGILTQYGDPRIRHMGPFPQAQLHRYYSRGSVFCILSIEDGFALVVLQAMMSGLPVILTPRVGAADLIEHGRDGFIVSSGERKRLKEVLRWCHAHRDDLRRMGMLAKKKVLNANTWRHYGDRMISHYKRILSG